MNKVCRDVPKERNLLLMAGERIETSTNTSNKPWRDISIEDFWIPIQKIKKMNKEGKRKYKGKKIM